MARFNCQVCAAEYRAKPSARRQYCSMLCAGRHFAIVRRGQEIVVPGTPLYSADDLALMRREAIAGKTARQIAALMPGRPLGGITQQLVRMRRDKEIPPFDQKIAQWGRHGGAPAYTPEQKDRVQELARTTALSWVKIGLQVGLTDHQVRRIIAAMPEKRQKPLSAKAIAHRKRRQRPVAIEAPPPAPFVAAPQPKPNPAAGLIAGCRPVGLHEAWRWWQLQGRNGRPTIGEINELRRAMGRPSFTIIGGRLTGIAA